jgi:N-methylhydantoinase B
MTAARPRLARGRDKAAALDPVTVEVIGNALISTPDEMLAALIKSAYSNNIKERQDCSTAIIDADGHLSVPSSMSIPIHLSSFELTGAAIFARFPKETIRPGDIFVLNDPYSGGPSHLADITFVAPVFLEGEILCFVANTGHWPDMGGKARGQASIGDATEIYQEGIRIPPVRLYRGGELQNEFLEILLLNIRDSHDREGDIRAHVGCLALGERRVLELVDRFGGATLRAALAELQNISETKTRHGLLQLPEGTYTAVDYLDDDAGSGDPVPIKVAITIAHRPHPSVTIDFTGTGPAVRWGCNSPLQGTIAAVYWALKSLLAPDVLPNAGFRRPIHLIAPEGCLVNCQPPSPCAARYQVCVLIPDLVFHALSHEVTHNIEAGNHGIHSVVFASRQPPHFVAFEAVGGGGGARPIKDGLGAHNDAINMPIEAMEIESPILVERLEYATDSGGPGRFRGGLGVRKDYRALRDLYVGSHSNRHRIPGPGMRGGKSGHGTSYVIDGGTSAAWTLPRNCSQVPIAAGQRVTITTGGGGGYGHPFERDPKLVLQDVVNGFVSRESAERDYGVVIHVTERRVDEVTTRTLREGATPV